MTYGNGATVSYTYDSLDRLVYKNVGNTRVLTNWYNARGLTGADERRLYKRHH